MLMRHVHPTLQFTHMLPYGAILHENGVQFVVFSRSATAMRLLLYDHVDDREPAEIIEFDREHRPLGRHLEHLRSRHQRRRSSITFRPTARTTPRRGQWFDGKARLIDPYAKALAGNFLPSHRRHHPPAEVRGGRRLLRLGRRSAHLRRSCRETIIYEMHVRGFTRGPVERASSTRARTWG